MDLATARWNLLWATQKSARYHARRQGFFDRWRMMTAGASVLLGSAAAVDLLGRGGLIVTLVSVLVVTALSTVDLIVGTSTAARLHSDLRRRFLELEIEIRCASEPISKQGIDEWTRSRLRIEADEPPVYVALDLLCENEMARAHGKPPRARISRWATATAQWFRWETINPHFPSAESSTTANKASEIP